MQTYEVFQKVGDLIEIHEVQGSNVEISEDKLIIWRDVATNPNAALITATFSSWVYLKEKTAAQ